MATINTKSKLAKNKAKSLASKKALTPKSVKDSIIALLPEMKPLHEKIKASQANTKTYQVDFSALEKKVMDLANTFQGEDESHEYTDGSFTLKVSAKAKTKQIPDIDPVILALENVKEGLALELATFKIGDLNKYLSPEEVAEITTLKVGNRRITY